MAMAASHSTHVTPSLYSNAHSYPSLLLESNHLAFRRLHGSLIRLPTTQIHAFRLRLAVSALKINGQQFVWPPIYRNSCQRRLFASAQSSSVSIAVVRFSSKALSTILEAISKFAFAAALIAKAMSKIIPEKLHFAIFRPLREEEAKALAGLRPGLMHATVPLCFAVISQSPRVSTPLTVIAAGMAKWLELYSGVLMIRVLLSWFPNIPWERQPLQAIRDMCDPYLNLFRNLIPPIFNALDVSPMLAFFVLGLLASILNANV